MIKVNLLSPERKEISGVAGEAAPVAEEVKEGSLSTGAGIAAAVITVAVIGFLYVTQAKTIENKKNELDEQNARKARLKDVEKTLQELEQAKAELTQKVALIGELKSKRLATVKMMDELSNALPEWVWLTRVTFSGNLLSLDGKAIHNNLIADFINNLKATNSFNNIDFKSSTKKKQSGSDVFTFAISCYYQEKQQQKR